MIPLHSWLPRAHPAAPSHASALMSGVMVKIGIFGILKVAMDLLAQTGLPLWWGILVMAIGAISALLGVLYALAEQDIKRLLAWSTVENVGIILLAVGVAMVGLSLHDPLLTVVGLLGALFHLLNHALFKGLLFLGAGAIISRLHTHDMEKMGALAKRMPWTAAACCERPFAPQKTIALAAELLAQQQNAPQNREMLWAQASVCPECKQRATLINDDTDVLLVAKEQL